MSYSLKSFFSKDDHCTIHLLQNKEEKKRNISFFIYKKGSQSICQLFETTSLLKELLNLQHSQYSIDSFLRIIGAKYRIGDEEANLNDEDLNKCFKDHHYELLAIEEEKEQKFKPPIKDEPEGSGTYGSVYLLLTETGGHTNYVVKIYIDAEFIEQGKPLREVKLEQNDNEQTMSLFLGEEGIGPHVVKTWGCAIKVESWEISNKTKSVPFRFIVMERYDENLLKYINKLTDEYRAAIENVFKTTDIHNYDRFDKKRKEDLENEYGFPDEIVRAIKKKLLDLKETKIQHTDLHVANIMLKFKDKKFDKLVIIDFGYAKVEDKFSISTHDIETLINSLREQLSLTKGEMLIMTKGMIMKKLLEELNKLKNEISEKYSLLSE